jgi:lysophosphatidate acyltransferase
MYLNVLLYVFSLGACSVLGVVVSPIMYLSNRNRLNINWVVARSFHQLAGSLIGLRFKVEGGEKFEKARPAVVVGNHQTGIDILYLGKVFPKQASIMAKQELKYAPFLGQFSE